MSSHLSQIREDPLSSLAGFGGRMAFFQASTVVFAVIGYVIWPHVFDDHDARMVLEGIQKSPFEYFMKLDPVVLFGTLLQLPVYLGLWSVLRKTDPLVSLYALLLGLISTFASLTIRPLRELYYLADLHEAAESLAREQVLIAAAEGLLSQFHGTAWAISIMCGGLAAMLFFVAMRKTVHFRKATQWTMLISGFGAVIVLVPGIGLVSLFVLATLLGVAASLLCGLDLLRFAREKKT
jgi:hypothetical protein